MDLPFDITQAELQILFAKALRVLLIIVLALVLQAVVRRGVHVALDRLAKAPEDSGRVARLRTLGGLVGSALAYVVFFIALLMVLEVFGVDTKAVLATAGVLGLAVGLGAQRLVRDIIAGFFLLLENQFSEGETVTLGGAGITGTVQEMGLRVTRLRDEIGRLVVVANGDITVVTNHSRGPLSVSVDLTLPGDTDLETVRHAVAEAAAALPREQWSQSPRMLGLVEAPEGKIKIRVAGQASPGQREPAEMALRAALRRALREKDVAV